MESFWLVSLLSLWAFVLVLAVVVVSLLHNLGVLATAVQQLQSGTQDTLLLEAGAPAPELASRTPRRNLSSSLNHGSQDDAQRPGREEREGAQLAFRPSRPEPVEGRA